MMPSRRFRALVLAAPLLALAACSVNPATGRQSFTGFMSRSDEMRIGASEHPKILKQFSGAYEDGEMAAYVRRTGRLLVEQTEVNGMPFTFTVLNHDSVNAFALPGGYVYVTRGLLALASDEAEMAGVLAHEIGHVTARHTAQRVSQARAADIGFSILGAIGGAAGVPLGLGDIAAFGAQAYLQGFSRDQELEADMLAVRYMRRAGYDASATIGFFHKLAAHDRLEATLKGVPSAAERFNIMSTHPRTVDRIAQAIRLAGGEPAGSARLGRDEFLSRVDGMLFGDDPSEGVRRGRVFAHPGLGIRFTVPQGYVMINKPAYVVARGPGKALIVFDMENPNRAAAVGDLVGYLVDDWGRDLSLRDVARITVNGMEAATGHGRLDSRIGPLDQRLVAISDGARRIFRLRFLTPPGETGPQSVALRRTTYSFRRLTPAEAAAIRPLRIRVVTARPGDTAEAMAARMPFETFRLEWFEALNGLARGQPLIPGERVKIVAE